MQKVKFVNKLNIMYSKKRDEKILKSFFSQPKEEILKMDEETAQEFLEYGMGCTFKEIGTNDFVFFQENQQELAKALVVVGEKFSENDKLMFDIVRILGIQYRFKVYTDTAYWFLQKQKYHKNKKIQCQVARFLFYFPQFKESWEGKWDYIVSILKIPPKKETYDFFHWSVIKNIDTICEATPQQLELIESKTKEQLNELEKKIQFVTPQQLERHNMILEKIAEFSVRNTPK